ncbi:Ankyrin-3 [Schistosoma japonicum]|nr:Ankyrin-3 [Schistosoma japonicum]
MLIWTLLNCLTSNNVKSKVDYKDLWMNVFYANWRKQPSRRKTPIDLRTKFIEEIGDDLGKQTVHIKSIKWTIYGLTYIASFESFEDMTKSSDGKKVSGQLNETEQNFLRAARAGDLPKVVELLNTGVHINLSNSIGLTALHLASKEGYVHIVDELLRRGADFDAPTKKGNTALHIASLAGHFEVVKLLLDAGANLNRQSVIGFTPLYMAAQENHLDVVDLLLQRGANQALTTEDGFTPLAVALQQGHDRVVAHLLEKDSRSRGGMPALHIAARKDDANAVSLLLNNAEVNVNHQSQPGFTPLHIAAHYGNVTVARVLIERGADVNFQAKNNITPLHVAAKWGRGGMVQLLLNSNALVDCRTRDGLTPLHCAARSGHAELASLLMGAGANPSAKTRNGLTPLHMAAQGNNEEVARVLILRGASVADRTGDSLTPLHVAAHCGNAEVARVLLDNGCDVNACALNGFTPLHIACKKQKIRVIELLLQYGAQINMTTESGLSPLHVAAFIGGPEIVQLLLQRGAHVNQATMRCETALHLAVRNRQVDVAETLIYHGASVNAKARDEQTPLHVACLTGTPGLISVLLSCKANPNLPARDGYTALHIAAKEGRHDLLGQLLEAGADLNARTKKGFTPLHLAAKRGQVKVAKQLIQAQPKSVNAIGQNDLTPLHIATHYNRLPVVQLLLDYDAQVDCRAGNGYTALHMAAKQNHLDIATLLLAHESDQVQIANSSSRSGFTPLHLAAQEGHTDVVSLLLQHGADPNHQSKNGLAPLHLAAQEDHVSVAQILISAGAEISPLTRAGYSPLHTACHFGQVNMVRYLLDLPNAPDINQRTQMGFTPLHLAAQQCHSQVVRLLLEMGADSNIRNQQGLTPAHIARKQHFITIFDILKTVTTTVVSWEEEHEELDHQTLMLEHPDFMHEHPFAELDEDGAAPSPAISRKVSNKKIKTTEYENLHSSDTADQKSHSDQFNSAFDNTILAETENDDIWGQLEYMHSTLSPRGTLSDHITSQKGDENTSEFIVTQNSSVLETVSPKSIHNTEAQMFGGAQPDVGDWDLEIDNTTVIKKPVNTGFLVSFIVDARGGLIQARRYPDLRIFIPPNVVNGPLRIVCRLVHPDRLNSPPIMNDGDGLACRLLEIGPTGMRFASPILLEIPHCAFLKEKNREIVILRSDNGETWKEHPLDATDQSVQDNLNGHFDYAGSFEELRDKSIHRILTYDLPQYFALITRIKQELILIGPEGGTLTSTVVPDVQVHFPPGALQKRIRVGLQVHPVDNELVTRMLGPRVSVSPIVTIEPRRRKFHKPITLTIPLPKTVMRSSGGGNNTASMTKSRSTIDSPSLRLLCSITGGTSPAVWEDITGSSPLSAHDCSVSFTSTVSARLWLVDCPNITEVVELASRVYHESLAVPYIGQFVVYARRFHPEEAQLRCLCLTDDSAEKTLELQEGFQRIATGPCIEVLDDHPHWIETAGNLVPVAKTEEQLQLGMHAFRENRLNMIVRVKDLSQPAVGKLAFMRHPRAVLQSAGSPVKPATVLEAKLPNEFTDYMTGAVLKTTDIDDIPSYIPEYDHQNGHQYTTNSESVPKTWEKQDQYEDEPLAKSELDLRQVAYHLKSDWRILAQCLGLSDEDQYNITSLPNRPEEEYAFTSLLLWQERNGNDLTTGTQLAEALQAIGRKDILEHCMTNIFPVVTADERATALRSLNGISSTSPNLNISREKCSHSKEGSGLRESIDTGYGTQTGSTTLLPSSTTPVITKTITSTVSTLSTSSNVDNTNQPEDEMIKPVTATTGRVYSGIVPSLKKPTGGTIIDSREDKLDALKHAENVLADSPSSLHGEEDKLNSIYTGPPVDEEIVVPAQSNRTVHISHTHDTNNENKQIANDNDLSKFYPYVSSHIESQLPHDAEKHVFDIKHENVSQYVIHDKEIEQALDHSQDHQSCEQVICAHHYQRCGELEATWGKAADQDVSFHDNNNTSEFHFDKVHEKQVDKAISDTSNEDKICARHYQRCGELEATWGKGADCDRPCGDLHTTDDKKYKEMLPAAPHVPSERSTSTHFHHHQPSDEATFSRREPLIRSSTEETMQEASSSQATSLAITKSSPVISKQEKLDKDDNIVHCDIEKYITFIKNNHGMRVKTDDEDSDFPDQIIVIPQMEQLIDSSEISSFDDAYYNMSGDLLHSRPLLEPLTPIPEISEYSTRSSVTSVNPSKSWQSSDLSPSESIESRSGGVSAGGGTASRRLFHSYLHPNRASHESFNGPQKSFKNPVSSVRSISSTHSEPDHIRRSYETHSMESTGQDYHLDLSNSLRTHSSHSSSLAEFLRLETSCNGSRGDDLCVDTDDDDDEDKQLTLGQHDQNFHDLIRSIQELRRQHLHESVGLFASSPSVDDDISSSNSRLAIGSSDIDHHAGESSTSLSSVLLSPPLPLVQTTSTPDMQQTQCVNSSSSNSLRSPKASSSPSSTTKSLVSVIYASAKQYF